MNKKIIQFFLFLSIFTLEISCQKQPIPSKEQFLKINFLEGLPPFFHPHLSSDTNGSTLCKALYEGLTRINLEGKAELALAKKIELSPCKKKYTISLKPSTWSNGVPLKAKHFVNAWKTAMAKGSKCGRVSHFFPIKNAEKVFKGELPIEKVGVYSPADNFLVIELEHPVPYFLKLLSDPIFSPIFDFVKEKQTVFNGPFVIKNPKDNKQITLHKNLLYWDHKTVKIPGVHISLIRDPNTAYSLYEKGELDWIGSPFCDLPFEIVRNLDKIRLRKVCSLHWIYFNLKKTKFQSAKIRKALSYAIDRNYITKYIFENFTPNCSMIPQDLSLIKTIFSPEILQDAKHLFSEGLKEIGIKRKNFEFILNYSGTEKHTKLAEFLKYQWEKVLQIKVHLQKDDWNSFFFKLRSSNYEMGGATRFVTYEDPIYFLNSFYSNHSNHSKWQNTKFQENLDFANHSINETDREKYLKKAEEILMEEMPAIPVYTHTHLYLCKDSLKNFYAPRLAYSDFKWAYFSE